MDPGDGRPTPALQMPSRFEKNVVRTLNNPNNELRTSHARTPHHPLNGTVTPNSLHFSINHSGLPDIDPEQHKLVIHGMVKQPLVFTLESLSRYPLVTRMSFVECSGNSAPMFSNEPMQANRAGAAWPRFQRRMDRRPAVDPAGRGRRRSEREMGDRRRRRCRTLCIAACR